MFNLKLLKKLMTKNNASDKSSTLPNIFRRYDKVKISNNLADLNGIGEEHLLSSDNEVIAIFIDGNFKLHSSSCIRNQEKTWKVIWNMWIYI